MSIAAFDVICVIIVCFFAIRGAFRGFVGEVMSFAAIGIGIGAAVLFTGEAVSYVRQYLGESVWNKVISFLGLFIIGYLLVKIIERMLVTIVERISLERLDQALGFLLGAVEGVILYSGIIILLLIQPFFDSSAFLLDSLTARLIIAVFPVIPDLFEKGASSVHV